MSVLLIGVAVFVGITFIVIGIYNGLVAKKNQVANVYASLDALLKKRFDLIPNLVESVKSYMAHEKGLLTELTQLRSQAASASPAERNALETKMSSALRSVLVAVENYPQLKANENVLHLQHSLTEAEEQISAGRRAFNAAVTEYNNALEMFPTNLLGRLMGYQPKNVYEAAPQERDTPNVGKLFNS